MNTALTHTSPAQRTLWKLDPAHSLVELGVKHMLFTTVKGRFSGLEGTLELDEANLADSRVEVALDAASIDTGDAQRDAHLRSADFLDADQYPRLTFRSTRVEPLDDQRLRVVGELTIRDVTREVVLDARYHGRGVNPYGLEVIGFSAETSLNRYDYGLRWNVALEAGGMLVGETVNINLEVQAVRQAD